MADEPKKELTELQQRFLDALAGEAKGDLAVAKKIAGYSDATRVSEIIKPIKEEVIAAAEEALAIHATKAVAGIIDILDKPSAPASNVKLKAATELLDRIGIIKKETPSVTVSEGTIFILPPKGG